MINFSRSVDRRQYAQTEDEADTKLAVVGRLTFLVYLVFVFFGTDMPFRSVITEVEDIATSNRANQVVVSLLFLTSVLSLIPKIKEIFSIIKKEKFLSLFLIWCLLSIVWSDFSFVSFKRLFQILATVSISLAGLLHTDDSEELLRYFKWVLYAYILLSVVSVVAVPGAKDPQFGTWRGLSPTKNHLGQAGLIGTLIWLYAFYIGSKKGRAVALTMGILSIILLIGSFSATSILTFVLLAGIWLVFLIDGRFKSLGVGRLFAGMAVFTFLALAGVVLYLAPDFLTVITERVGKDATFSGRTDLWLSILEEVRGHAIIGTGFGAFWVMDNPDLQYLYQDFIWLPRQSHLGYLDILNETGLVGMMLFGAAIVAYFKNLMSFGGQGVWKWILIAVLVVNLMETTLLRPNIITGTLFIFCYLAFYADVARQ